MTTSRRHDEQRFLRPTSLAALLAFAAAAPAVAQQPAAPAAAAPAAAAAKPAAKPPARKPAARAAKPPAAQQAGFSAADAGYKAFEQRDYATAIAQAGEAVRLVPSKREWWVLLANSLAAAGRHAEADQAIERGIAAAGADATFTQAREAVRRAQAQAAGAEMYKALQANDLPRAIEHARAAVQAAPEHPGFRLALVHALLRAGQFGPAEQVATEAVALLPDSAVPLALRAYARQRLDRWPDARADLDRALQQRGLTPAAQRELRLISADASLAAAQPQRALELLQPLPEGDSAAAPRRSLARQMISVPGAGTAITLLPPAIDCSNVDAAQTCSVTAAAAPADPGYTAASAAYRAMESGRHAQAWELARQAAAASPGNRDYQLLLMNAALAANQLSDAEAAATAALALNARDAAVLAQRSAIRRRAGNSSGANQDANAALELGGLPPGAEATLLADLGRVTEARGRLAAAQASMPPLDLAYLASRTGDPAAAADAFKRADAARALPVTSLQDAGYAAMKDHRDQEAIDYFKRSVDAAGALQLKMDKQALFDTRRTISEIDRKFGVLASLTWRQGGGVEPGFGVTNAGQMRTLQAGAEAYWRPWGFRNGRFVELFLRGFETLHSENGGVTGSDSFAGAAGVRFKPFTQHNIVLSASRLFGSGVASDWLIQAAYSFDHGTDIRVDVPSWWTTRIAAEVGRYLDPGQTYGLASAQFGRSWRLGGDNGRTILFPHAVLAAEYNSSFAEKTSVGFGPGVSLRHWFREDVYHAPRSFVDFTLQYRVHVGGDERIKGTYFNTLLSY